MPRRVDRPISKVEVLGVRVFERAPLRERSHTAPIRRRVGGELVLEQIDDDRVEAARRPIVKIPVDVFRAQLRHQ